VKISVTERSTVSSLDALENLMQTIKVAASKYHLRLYKVAPGPTTPAPLPEEEERDWNDYQHEKFIEMRNDLHEAELSELETEGEEDEPGIDSSTA
jgi:hypothetical protein